MPRWRDAIAGANLRSRIRCLLIAGVPGAFCAGNDLKDFQDAAKPAAGSAIQSIRFLHALASCEKPLVAAVKGIAVGIGTTMLFHCDYVVAARDANFSTPFVEPWSRAGSRLEPARAAADGPPPRLRAAGDG